MSGEEITIRAFTPEDWAAMCDVYGRSAECELATSGIDPHAYQPLPDEENLEKFQRMNSAKVACVDGQVVGFVAWRDRGEWRDSGFLSWLYVDPLYHQRGIGGRLMAEAMSALGGQAWTLVKQGNEPAIRLYRKYGMRVVRTRRADAGGYPCAEVRLALPSSRKFDPAAPNFGV